MFILVININSYIFTKLYQLRK